MANLQRRVAPNLKNTLALPDYVLEVTYLGNDAVAKDAAYRCTFELVKEGNPPPAVAKDAVIPKADKNEKYRILVHDNHGATNTDINARDMLGHGANVTSKPDCYRSNNWIRDVRPAAGFRVTVKKMAAGVQVTLAPDEVFITWKVKDPEEEFDKVDVCRSPDQPKKFLKEFFKKFKRKTDDAGSKEDDNCSDQFGGVRQRDGVTDACDVLFKSPFATGGPVKLDRQPNPADMPKKDTFRDKLAWSEVKPDSDKDGKPIGISDVFVYPPPISGDNYIFSIGLATQSGVTLDFLDSDGKRIKVYETGPFTMWRKLTIDLMVTFDSVNQAYINWNDVKNTYAAAFMEIVPPTGGVIVSYNQATWRSVVRDYLINTAGKAQVDVDGAVWDFNRYLLPALAGLTDDNCWTYGQDLAKLFLDRTYRDRKMTPPARPVDDLDHVGSQKAADLVQDTCPGLRMFLCKGIQTGAAPIGCSVLGMYMGDREFFMVTVGDATCTFAHELGHAVYIRHSLTKFDAGNGVTADNNGTDHIRGAWLDHDQEDAVVCLMSYENDYYGADGVTKRAAGAVEWHFCAVCLLKLRFWDTVLLRQNKMFRKFIYSRIKPLKLANDSYANLGSHNLARGDSEFVLCLAKAEAATNNSGGPYKKNVTNMFNGSWHSSQAARADFTTFQNAGVTYNGQLDADAANTGKTTIDFAVDVDEMKSNSVTVKVT